MADNKFLNTNWVSMEILRLLLNKLVVSESFSTDWQGDYEKEFAPGATIQVKLPWRPLVKNQMGWDPQGIERVTTTITLDRWIQIPFEWDDYERAVKLERSKEELNENYWDPCGAAMAQEMDSQAAQFAYQNASNVIGVLGTDPTLVGPFYSARAALQKEACPPGKRNLIISTTAMASMGASTASGSIVSMFHPGDEVTRMFKDGYIGKLSGFDVFESNSLWSHTAGTWQTPANVKIHGAGQSGTQIIIEATAGDTFNVGDKFCIGTGATSCNAVNPATRRIAGAAEARRFTITQRLVAVGDNTDVLSILPAIYGPGSPYQNVDALPANGAVLTLWPGTASPNGKVGTVGLALSRYAFAKVGTKLYLPKAVEDRGQATDPDTKLSVRKVSFWDPVRSMNGHRMDSLVGFGTQYQASGACAIAMG